MKRSKKMIILIVILFIAVLVFLLLRNNDKKEEENTVTIESVDGKSIEKISWKCNDEEICIVKSKEKWVLFEDNTFPLNQDIAKRMAEVLGNLKQVEIVTEKNYEEYGLDEKNHLVTVTLTNGKVKVFNIGNYNDILGKCYITISSDDNIYLVDGFFKSMFEISKDNLRYAESTKEMSL